MPAACLLFIRLNRIKCWFVIVTNCHQFKHYVGESLLSLILVSHGSIGIGALGDSSMTSANILVS